MSPGERAATATKHRGRRATPQFARTTGTLAPPATTVASPQIVGAALAARDEAPLTLALAPCREELLTAPFPLPWSPKRSTGQASQSRGPSLPVAPLAPRSPRAPAPLVLRLAVLGLFELFLLVLSGLVLLHVQPSWNRWLRGELLPRPSATVIRPGTTEQFHGAPGSLRYVVPTTTYSIGVEIDHPCWVVVRQLESGTTLFATTLQPASAPPFAVRGSTSIEIAARATAIVLRSGGRVLGTIPDPVVGVVYQLQASTASQPTDAGAS